MRICMFTNTYLPHVGGVARSVETFAEEYRQRKNRVLVVAPTFAEKDGKPTPKERGVERLPAIQNFNGSDFSVRLPMMGGFTDVMNRFKAQVVHAHHPFLLGDTALRYASALQAPVVFTHHTMYEQYTHYVPFDSATLKQFVIELSTNFSNLCDAVIAPSQSIATLIQQRGVTVPIEVIPTGVDVEAFAGGDGRAFRKAQRLSPRAFVVGHVGRLAPEKNLEFMTRAIAQFLRRAPNAYFVVIGGGPSEEAIRSVMAKEQLTERLIMPGKRTGQDLYDAYRAMNVFAFSSFSETQGMVVAEAMAAGVPVVALDAPGVREVVNEQNGFLLPADANEKTYADRLAQLYSQAPLRRRLATGAKRTAKLFARERCAGKALELYEHLQKQKRRERAATASDPWTSFLDRFDIEWRLLSQKAESAYNALVPEDKAESVPS